MENRGFFLEYEEARPHLICRLVVSENETFLKKVPFCRAFEGIMAVPCIYELDNGQKAGRPVTLFQAAQWDVEPIQLLRDAIINMQNLFPPRFRRMSGLMESSMKGSLRNLLLSAMREKTVGRQRERLEPLAEAMARHMGRRLKAESGLKDMWVLGNDAWLFGATSLLFPGVLYAFAEELGGNFYILPSSIHEAILLPEGGRETRELLYGMVRGANARLEPSKFLSNSVYYYDRNKMEIRTL